MVLKTLTEVSKDSIVKILEIKESRNIRLRLLQMGLIPGAMVKIILNSQNPIIINVNGSLIAISKSLANRIIVQVT